MAKQKINLKVAGKAYSLTIDSEKEEIYRLAERDVNSNVGKLQKTFGESFSVQDCLAITALQWSINDIAVKRENSLASDDLAALDALSQKLDKHLNRIARQPRKGQK